MPSLLTVSILPVMSTAYPHSFTVTKSDFTQDGDVCLSFLVSQISGWTTAGVCSQYPMLASRRVDHHGP